MLEAQVNIPKKCIHMRPAAILCEISKLFAGYKITLRSSEFFFETNQIMQWIFSEPKPNPFTLQVEVMGGGDDDTTSELALIVMSRAIAELELIKEALSSSDRGDVSSVLFRELYSKISDDIKHIEGERKDTVLFELETIFGLHREQQEAKRKAILNSKKGLHIFPSKLLENISHILKSKVTLSFISTSGEPSSEDINSSMGLLCASIRNGTEIFIKARGTDCEESACVVQYILENIDPVIHPWIHDNGSVDNKESTEKFLSFIKSQLRKEIKKGAFEKCTIN